MSSEAEPVGRDELRRAAARVVVAGFVGPSLPASLGALPLGGVILFARNVGSPSETAARVKAIRERRDRERAERKKAGSGG